MGLSLYRKYRPKKFSEMIGQDHIKTTLSSQVKSGRIAHAYLFCGTRGTGKTTTARILAKAINCAKAKDGEPCNVCVVCKDFMQGRSMDLVEIDAASNRGIDEIREVIEKVKFAPSSSKYKVFVIDEAHMLTREAFNAFLKTLEEPPAHAVFILATTEPHKLPATILSRVQRFDFKRVGPADIAKRLSIIARKEKIKVAPEALLAIVESADGSFRDAENLLDQVASYVGKNIKLSDVELLSGASYQKSVIKLIDYIIDSDAKSAILFINQLLSEGYDLSFFTKNTIEYLRKLLLIKTNAVQPEDVLTETKQPIVQVNNLSAHAILSLIKAFIEAGKDIKSSAIPQLPLEMAILELIEDKTIAKKMITLSPENKVAETNDAPIYQTIVNDVKKETQKFSKSTKKITKKITDLANIDQLIKAWPNLLISASKMNHSLATLLRSSVPVEMKNDTIKLAVHFKFHRDQILSNKRRDAITDILKNVTGNNYQLDCILADEVDEKIIQNVKTKIAKMDRQSEKNLLKSVSEVFGI